MNTDRVRIGVIGCANIAERYVIPAITDLPGKFALTGIASRNVNKASQFAEKFNTNPFPSYDSLIESGLIDAVYIPLPNALHQEWIGKALEQNLHVLVEKSLACRYDESIVLNQEAQRKNIVLVENFQFRFHRQLKIINQILKDKVIGELRYLRSTFGFPPFPDPLNIRYQPSLGGGSLLDAGAYTIRIAQYFLGNDLTVSAANLTFDPVKGVDLWGGAFLEQKSGNLFAELAFGFDYYYQCNLELLGSKGIISANRIFTAPPGFSPEITIETAEKKEKIVIQPDNHFKNMLVHFYKLITGQLNAVNEYKMNINQARLIEELKQKAN